MYYVASAQEAAAHPATSPPRHGHGHPGQVRLFYAVVQKVLEHEGGIEQRLISLRLRSLPGRRAAWGVVKTGWLDSTLKQAIRDMLSPDKAIIRTLYCYSRRQISFLSSYSMIWSPQKAVDEIYFWGLYSTGTRFGGILMGIEFQVLLLKGDLLGFGVSLTQGCLLRI